MSEMRLSGKTLQQVGKAFGVSRERVRQIVNDIKPRMVYRKYVKSFCEVCGEPDKDNIPLHVHHIDHDHKNNNPINLMTLCRQCHGSESMKTIWRKSIDWEGYVRANRIRAYKYKYPDREYPY